MPISYYPGCTLSTKAKMYDVSGRAVAAALGLDLEELADWNCCGATFPLAMDNLLSMAGPARVLVEARGQGQRVATLCAICFNVLKRTNHFLLEDEEKRDRLNYFIEADYSGDLQVQHFLEILRDELGFAELGKHVAAAKEGRLADSAPMKVAPYYGCLLLRPEKELELDSAEDPRILEDMLRACGFDPVEFSHRVECCGSYLLVNAADVAEDMSYHVLDSAVRSGADLLITACPLCHYNLDYRQDQMAANQPGFTKLPVLYFTQLLALALGLDASDWEWSEHHVDPRPVLREHGLLP